MYEGGKGGGDIATVATGAVSTTAGIAILPNTGGNAVLMVVSIAAIVVGVIITGSFAITRIASRFYR